MFYLYFYVIYILSKRFKILYKLLSAVGPWPIYFVGPFLNKSNFPLSILMGCINIVYSNLASFNQRRTRRVIIGRSINLTYHKKCMFSIAHICTSAVTDDVHNMLFQRDFWVREEPEVNLMKWTYSRVREISFAHAPDCNSLSPKFRSENEYRYVDTVSSMISPVKMNSMRETCSRPDFLKQLILNLAYPLHHLRNPFSVRIVNFRRWRIRGSWPLSATVSAVLCQSRTNYIQAKKILANLRNTKKRMNNTRTDQTTECVSGLEHKHKLRTKIALPSCR